MNNLKNKYIKCVASSLKVSELIHFWIVFYYCIKYFLHCSGSGLNHSIVSLKSIKQLYPYT